MDQAMIEFRKVTKEFGAFTAVHELSLGFEKGKFHTLLGPSGCGKTTLLRMIAGFESPSRGEILHQGKPINELPPNKRDFPMVFQSYALFPHMTVAANVSYGLRLRKLSSAEISRRLAAILKLLDLEAQKNKYPFQMSGGQQQRVALARALVMEPEVILFDEPLSNLDAKLRLSMREEIRALQRRLGITAIYVTHDQEEALAISDQIVVLNHGKIEQKGSPIEVYQRPATAFVARFLGCTNIFPVLRSGSREIRLLNLSYDLGGQQPAEGTSVVLRPDSFELSKGSGRHRAVIESAMFLGSRFQYTLDCDGTKLSIDAPWNGDAPAYSVGENVTFDLNTVRLHFV
jgi:ABC-type Fe3+/spermidine/putrescine transport system ATPase subunit